MRVNSVLVEEVLAANDRRSAKLRSMLYGFREPQWVSVHGEREGKRLGPITWLDPYREDLNQIEQFAVTEFPERTIAVDDKAISYRERWTIGAGTVYAVVPPEGFLATRIQANEANCGVSVSFESATTSANGIFYYATFRDPTAPRDYDIEARFEYEPRDCEEARLRLDVVDRAQKFGSLRTAVTEQALSPDFWFRLFDFVGKFTT